MPFLCVLFLFQIEIKCICLYSLHISLSPTTIIFRRMLMASTNIRERDVSQP